MEEAIRGKEDEETGNALTLTSLPPKLNLRRLESIQRLLQYGSVLILFVFITLIVVSYFQWRETIRAIKLNEDKIVEQTVELKQQQYDLDRQKDDLNKQQETLNKNQTLIEENEALIKSQSESINQKSNIISALQKSTLSYTENNPKLGNQLKETIENNLSQAGNSASIPARIYIQIANEAQRKRAADIARQLQNKGFIVPGIENVYDKAPKSSELRTCQKDNIAKNDLRDITTALKSLSVNLNPPQFLSNCGKGNPRQYELWFGTEF